MRIVVGICETAGASTADGFGVKLLGIVDTDGIAIDCMVGEEVQGVPTINLCGLLLGDTVGDLDGILVGRFDGRFVGTFVGSFDGLRRVGTFVGEYDDIKQVLSLALSKPS